ncbi:MAG TPA: MopE-related protein, partial [Polyangia bacterium]
DCFLCGSATSCQFPQEFEVNCGRRSDLGADCGGAAPCCVTTAGCYVGCTSDGTPTVAGQPYRHSVYAPEFGAAGGDKGCRDGWDGAGYPNTGSPADTHLGFGGAGGGRLVLTGLTGAHTGTVTIQGQVIANGRRGCGHGNDSAGGGAGGTVLIVGDRVTVGPAALIAAAGGLGGDTQPDAANCPAPAQNPSGGTCDDCGGGGGGGIVSILSRDVATLDPRANFNVNGSVGGTCPICRGEAGGGAGELQLEGGYVGEICDDYDNDFDGINNNGLPADCSGGNTWKCAQDPVTHHWRPEPCPIQQCPALADTRARFALIADTSGSMLTTLSGLPTYGDGSEGHRGGDLNADAVSGNDSKLFMAKSALTSVIAAYPEIDFALARYHQDELDDRSCQLAHWIECNQMCCSYDDPRNNRPDGGLAVPGCSLFVGFGPQPDGGLTVSDAGTVPIYAVPSPAHEECINYAGTCGAPRRGADFVAGFGSPIDQYLMWLNGTERNFSPSATPGDYCDFLLGGDCELRGTGPTPLAGSLQAAQDYIKPIRDCDQAAACRKYAVILLTDGAESCALDGNGGIDQTAAVTAATALYNDQAGGRGIETYVVGFSVQPAEQAQLNLIARAGSGGTRDAFFVGKEADLANTLASIVASGIRYEQCNGLDDNCNGLTDENWPEKNQPLAQRTCTVGTGRCQRSGHWVCKPDGSGTCCGTDDGSGKGTGTCLTAGAPIAEVCCNNIDDDCDGLTDEPPCSCTEICDGVDNNGNGQTDEGFPVGQACTNGLQGECARSGTYQCSADHLGVTCNAPQPPPQPESCDCKDNDCNGLTDEGVTRACYGGPNGTLGVGICHGGVQVCATTPGPGCTPNVWSTQCVGEQTPVPEVCNNLDDNCDGATDEGLERPTYSGPPATRDVGECRAGHERCAAGVWSVDTPEVLPQPETCNGKDDDCNGFTDDGLAAVVCWDGTVGCDPQTGACVGVCRLGSKSCVGGSYGACQGQVQPGAEECNGLDDDCDGTVDNPPPGGALPGVGVACHTLGGCPGTTICDPNLHGIVCQPASGGVEICNGLDDDCDNQIDEAPGPGEPPLCDAAGLCAGDACVPPLPPGVDYVCAAGHYACVNGLIDCVGAVLPEPEVCDGVDNDCDGETDEGDLCDAGAVCWQGECVLACKQDEFPCPGGKVCLDGASLAARAPCQSPGVDLCFCVGSACLDVNCPAGWLCHESDGACHDTCAGVACDPGQECRGGRCVDCTTLGCPAGQVCAGGQCITNPCDGKECPAGTYCTAGACVSSCDLMSCPAGQTCRAGVCEADACLGETCPYGRFCNPETGACQDDPCTSLVCAPGSLCSPRTGQCVPDPCLLTTCDTCTECRADAYWQRGTCELRPECARVTIVAAGGGCRAAGSGGGGPLLGLLGLALLVLRRRGRAARKGGR